MILESTDKLIKMIQYVEQEGHEKADEIDAKAEDEFNMEKQRLLTEACIKIDEEYHKKRIICLKRHKMELMMMTSTSRKNLIHVKQNAINELLVHINEIVIEDMKCPSGRWAILELLILEGLFKLLEEKVVIKCREQDAIIIHKYIPELETAYYQRAQKSVTLKIDPVPLKNNPIPGVTLLVNDGKIILNNSLADRMEQVFEYFIPVISSIFYETRKLDTKAYSFVTFY